MMITMMMNKDQVENIAAMMAEDPGAPELRHPLASGMQDEGSLLGWLLSRLFGSDR